MAINTGRRTIFDVFKGHVGHDVEIKELKREGIVFGVELMCNTCNLRLLRQETQNWETDEEVQARRARRLGAKSYDQWYDDFNRQLEADHEADCDSDEWEPTYECTEYWQFYVEYLDGIEHPRKAPIQPWSV